MPGSRDARHATGVPARAAACRNIPAQSLLQTEAGRGRSRRPRLAASKRPCQIGAQCVPGGGMSSQIRLRMIETIGATVVCCTPTYALRLADLAAEENGVGKDAPPLSEGSVRVLIVAGEPGGSIAATRERIERSWGARVIDHHGLTETGPISFECWESPGDLHVNEGEYICEVLDPSTGRAVPDGQKGELVVTNLGRAASPVIRYRTG